MNGVVSADPLLLLRIATGATQLDQEVRASSGGQLLVILVAGRAVLKLLRPHVVLVHVQADVFALQPASRRSSRCEMAAW